MKATMGWHTKSDRKKQKKRSQDGRSVWCVTGFTMLTFISTATAAEAGLRVCNQTANPAKVALGRVVGHDWRSLGWWQIPPGKCAGILPEALAARYYYLYGTDGRSGTWSGSRSFCTAEDTRFEISGRGDCALRGYDVKGFFEIDTQDRADWTEFLSD